MKFNERIRALRTEKNNSQEKVAELMDVSCQVVTKWESGASLPDTRQRQFLLLKKQQSLRYCGKKADFTATKV